MDIKTRRITETPELESLTDATNVLVEDGGKVKRVPAKELIPEVPEVPEIHEQVQADLAENDETNPAHVKNRILWVEKKMVELPITGEWQEPDEGKFAFTITAPLGLEIGKTYVVNCNGTDYTVVGKDVSAFIAEIQPGVILGNASVMGGLDTGEPFAIVETTKESYVAGGFCGQFSTIDCANNVPFSIKHEVEIVHKLPMKFLPKGYPYTEEGFVEIMPEQEVTFEASEDFGGLFLAAINPEKKVLDGTYLFTFDGVEYVCESVLADDMPPTYALGNEVLMGGTNDTGEPFAMMAAENVQMLAAREAGTFKVGIKAKGEIVHPIDPELLPEGYPYSEEAFFLEKRSLVLEVNDVLNEGMITGIVDKFDVDLIPGDKYIVNWGGTDYVCTYQSDGVSGAMGNTAIFDDGDTGEPFFMINFMGMYLFVPTNQQAATIEVSIKGMKPVPLAEKYLPKAYYDLDLTSVNFPVVDVNGTDTPFNQSFEIGNELHIAIQKAFATGRPAKVRFKATYKHYYDANNWQEYNEREFVIFVNVGMVGGEFIFSAQLPGAIVFFRTGDDTYYTSYHIIELTKKAE